jgi:hypothetical protein
MDFRTLQTSVAVLFFFIGQTSTYREKQSTSFNIVNVLAFEKSIVKVCHGLSGNDVGKTAQVY